MNNQDNNKYAFPRASEKEWPQQRGLSKREYFAIQLMAARLAQPKREGAMLEEWLAMQAMIARKATDALLEALK